MPGRLHSAQSARDVGYPLAQLENVTSDIDSSLAGEGRWMQYINRIAQQCCFQSDIHELIVAQSTSCPQRALQLVGRLLPSHEELCVHRGYNVGDTMKQKKTPARQHLNIEHWARPIFRGIASFSYCNRAHKTGRTRCARKLIWYQWCGDQINTPLSMWRTWCLRLSTPIRQRPKYQSVTDATNPNESFAREHLLC